MFLLANKPIVSFNPKELKNHLLSIELFEPLPEDEYNNLKNDIKERGIQDALHIIKQNDDYVVISGHQRKKIAIELKINVPCIIRDDLKEEWQIEEQLIKDNLLRRHLTDYQRYEAGKRLEPIEQKKAKERQEATLPKKGQKGFQSNAVEKLPPRKSRDKVAKQLGISGRQYDKIKIVGEKAPEEIKEKWKSGDISTNQAYIATTKKDKGMSDHDRNIIFSSKNDNWETPPHIYDKLNEEFNFDFDPCPLTPKVNGLEVEWGNSNFVNPPYSFIKEFLQKGHEELNKKGNKKIVYLIPVRTDTNWFHTYIYPYYKKEKKPHAEIRFLKGRIKFLNGGGEKHSAPFPSMVVIFRSDNIAK